MKGAIKISYAATSKNLFSFEDWIVFYDAEFAEKMLRKIKEFPWSEKTLSSLCPLCGNKVKNCHFGFLGINLLNGDPLTILKFQKLHLPYRSKLEFASYKPESWYSKENFAKKTSLGLRWYLLHKNIIPGSEDKTYEDQKAMLPEEYEIPQVVEETAKDILVFQKSGVLANPARYARCIDESSDGERVSIGHSAGNGLRINNVWGENRVYNIGIGASRKLGT